MVRFSLVLSFILIILSACGGEDAPLPTPLNPQGLATQRAVEHTQTAIMQMTQQTYTPTATPSTPPTRTPTLTPTLRLTATPRPTDSPTLRPSLTPTPIAPTRTHAVITATQPITATPTASITATRVLDPDGLIQQATFLQAEPVTNGEGLIELAVGTPLKIIGRTADDRWLRVGLMGGGDGWVATQAVMVLVNLGQVPFTEETPSAANATTRILTIPPTVAPQGANNAFPFQPYDFATCGDTYWLGDDLGVSLETYAYQGRYPRFSQEPLRVYVHGLSRLSPEAQTEWELAISLTFAELSQAVRLERVFTDDLEFFQPFVPMETLLLEERVDLVWHLTDPTVYQAQAPCEDDLSCGVYDYNGFIMGGPLLFGGIAYIPSDADQPQQALLTAALPALGLAVQSVRPDDLMGINSEVERLSARDVRTLRCLYNAPPYGAR